MKRAKRYIKQVKNGEITVGKWIKLAISRHLRDIEASKDKDFPYYFKEAAAQDALDFIELQRFAIGEKSGQPFELLDWQAALIAIAYGWRRKADNLRRFTRVVVKVPRGNGKTELLATVGNIGFLHEPERDPQIYWIATKKDQAKIGWSRQKTMIENLAADFEEVAAMVGTTAHRIHERDGVGYVAALGRDSKTEDGFSPFYALADELHAWETDALINVVESGMVKRRRPMSWVITTEGYVRDGPWDELEESCHNMLQDILPQDELLAFLFDMDENDDWKDEKNWSKANPSLGVSVMLETFRTNFRNAVSRGGTTEADFKTKNLNIKQRAGHGWVKDEHWQLCPDKLPDLTGRRCFGGIDLSSTFDFSALCLLFPSGKIDDEFAALWWYWLPEERFEQRAHKFPVFRKWADAGFIRVVPGNYIDYEYIADQVREVCKLYDVVSIGSDPANAWQTIGELQGEGIPIESYSMSFANVSEPTKQIERAFAGCRINHGGNPVTRWQVQNVAIKTDSNGNQRPNKAKAKDNIDGVVAAIIALGIYLCTPDQPESLLEFF